MNKKPVQDGRRQPVLTLNDHGQPIVFVPLANHSRPARIDAKDFEMLLAEGYSDQWNFNRVGWAYGFLRCNNGKIEGGGPFEFSNSMKYSINWSKGAAALNHSPRT